MGMKKRLRQAEEANYARENGRYPDKTRMVMQNGTPTAQIRRGSLAGPGTLRAGEREAKQRQIRDERLKDAAGPVVTRQQIRAAKRQSGI